MKTAWKTLLSDVFVALFFVLYFEGEMKLKVQ